MATHNDVRSSSSHVIENVPYVKQGTNLCRLPNGLNCMGCCGMDFIKKGSTKEDFIAAMKQSADEFKTYTDSMTYKRRVSPNDLHGCGQCKQLIVTEDGTVAELAKKKHINFTCPLHPAENNGKEFRIGECDPNFMCEAQKAWHTWDENEQMEFLKFLETKNLDWFTYSKLMNEDALLKEFIETW